MHEISDQQWRRILVRGTVVGFTGIFMLVFLGCLLAGVNVVAAAGCAIVPAIQGSWFYGGTAYMMRADLVEEKRRKADVVALRSARLREDGAQRAA
jgi:hypothetical protein